MAISSIIGKTLSAVSSIIGKTKSGISTVVGQDVGSEEESSGGDITVAFYSGDWGIYEDTDDSSITSLTTGGSDSDDDPKFYIQYGSGPTTIDKTSESQSSTETIGKGNSKTYFGIRFEATGGFGGGTSGNITSGGVSLVTTAVGTAASYHVEISTASGGWGAPSPSSQTGGDSDSVTISSSGTKNFTWSSNTPSLTAGTKYWIVFVDES